MMPQVAGIAYRVGFAALLGMLFSLNAGAAKLLLDVESEPGPEPKSGSETYVFNVARPGVTLGVRYDSKFSAGSGVFRISTASDTPVFEKAFGQDDRHVEILAPLSESGTMKLTVTTEGAVGTWNVKVITVPASAKYFMGLTGPLMLLVAFGFVLRWRMRTGVAWRWFWMGVLIWTVGVALKFAWALSTNAAILGALKEALPNTAYLALGSFYVGLLTGVFEIGVTLVFALIWRNMAAEPHRAVAIGVGAGAFEAALLGLASLSAAVTVLAGAQGGDWVLFMNVETGLSTSLIWLCGPIERILAILCHTGSRALVLLGVAQKRRLPFWYGFLILTAIDTVAGYVHLAGLVGNVSMWWVELALTPFALACIPITGWCLRQWPVERGAERVSIGDEFA